MERVGCLYRVSTEKQADKNNEIQMQQIVCRDYARQQGWCIVKEISEAGISGYKTETAEREGIQSLLEDARTGKFDILLVYMFDRIGRRAREMCLIISISQNFGVRVYSVIEGELDSSDGGELVKFIQFWSAERESRHTQLRVDTRLRQLVPEGEFRGGAIPYGYRLKRQNEGERAYLVQSQHEASAVKLIFDFFLSGKSVDWIGKELERCGYLPRKAKHWSRSNIYAILKNVTYTGKMKYGDVFSPLVERLQIVSREQFEQAQMRMMRKESIKAQSIAPKNQFHICCALCGVELKTKIFRKKTIDCAGKVVGYEKIYDYCPCGSHPKGKKKYFSAENIHTQVTEKIAQERAIVYSDKMRAVRRLQTARYTLRANQKALQEEYDKKNTQRYEVITGMLMNSKEDLSADIDALTTEMNGLRTRIEELSAKIEKMKAFVALLKCDEILQKEVATCELLFDSIAVDSFGSVVFTYSAVGEILMKGESASRFYNAKMTSKIKKCQNGTKGG